MKTAQYFSECILCDSAHIKDLTQYRRAFLCRCLDCGFVFSRRIPSFQELTAYYSKYSYAREYYISPVTLKRYREILKSFEPYRKLNTLLDVGCGNGIFLSVAKELGWEVYGTEFSSAAVKVCRENGLPVLEGKLSDIASRLPEMDVVVSIEVIEHIQQPQEELTLINKLLRPGGLFYVTTPNFNALMRHWQKENYSDIVYPEHLSYYTRKTLKKLLTQKGFKTDSITSTGFSVSKLQNALSEKKENPFTANSADEKLRQKMETRFYMKWIKKTANMILDITGTGSSLKGRFVKKFM